MLDERDDRDEFDREAQAQWEKRRPKNPITEKPSPMTGADRVEVQQLAGQLRRVAHSADSDELCGFSLLLKEGCWHCRPDSTRPPDTVDGKWRRIVARFPGKCAGCGKPFDAGVDIGRTEDKQYVGPCCVDGESE